MRLLVPALALTLVFGPVFVFETAALAQSSDCTGENCPAPGGSSGHDCEREKKEDTVS